MMVPAQPTHIGERPADIAMLRRSQWMIVAAHVAMIGTFMWMSVRSGRRTFMKVLEGYDAALGDPLYIGILALPVILASLTLIGLAVWIRMGDRRMLIGGDVVAVACGWTVLLMYAFVDLSPVLGWALESLSLSCAAVLPSLSDPSRRPSSVALGGSALVALATSGLCVAVFGVDTSLAESALLYSATILAAIALLIPLVVILQRLRDPMSRLFHGAR